MTWDTNPPGHCNHDKDATVYITHDQVIDFHGRIDVLEALSDWHYNQCDFDRSRHYYNVAHAVRLAISAFSTTEDTAWWNFDLTTSKEPHVASA